MEYYIRLDDACEKRNVCNWDRMENILDEYGLIPLVGVIPYCEDSMMKDYVVDSEFWERVKLWKNKQWRIALHGYNHVCITEAGGINPVNYRSEYAGVDLQLQKEKIKKGVRIFREHGIEPKIFFAPSHTFDENTLDAIIECSDIRIVSDTVANSPYCYKGITFIPQQSGAVRKLPFKTVTFCYHPNTMKENDFIILEKFLKNNSGLFKPFPLNETKRQLGLWDRIIRWMYFARRKKR